MDDTDDRKVGAQTDRLHLRVKGVPAGRTNAAAPVDIKFLGTNTAPTSHTRPSTARTVSANRPISSRRTSASSQGQQASNADKAATVAAIYLGRFPTSRSPQKDRESARNSTGTRYHSDTESQSRTSRGGRSGDESSAGDKRLRRRTDSWTLAGESETDQGSPQKQRRGKSLDLSSTGGVTLEQRPRVNGVQGDRTLGPLARAANRKSERESAQSRVPPLKLLGNIFPANHIPQNLKHRQSAHNPPPSKAAHHTPRQGKVVEAAENKPPQVLRQVQCSREIAEAFHTRRNGASVPTKQVGGMVQTEAAQKGERVVLSARGSGESNRQALKEKRPQTARESSLHKLRVEVPARNAPIVQEAPRPVPQRAPILSYIGENPLAKPAWADWQPPLPMRALRNLATKTSVADAKHFFHEKQSPSPPTVLFHPSSPTSSIGSLDMSPRHSGNASCHSDHDSCPSAFASCHCANDSCQYPRDNCQNRDSCQQPRDSCHWSSSHELPHQRRADCALPPRASLFAEDDQAQPIPEPSPAHMSFGSTHLSRPSYIASSSPRRFGRLSSATTSDVSEEEVRGDSRSILGVGSSDFALQDELKPTPFSLRSHPVNIPDATCVGGPLVQSPPNLPRHLIQTPTPCSPNLSRGFMIGQFDGQSRARSAEPEREGPLAPRGSNGVGSCPGIPRPGLAQQLHDSLNNPNALPGYSVGPVIGQGGFCKVRLGTHLVSGEKVAIKVIDKTRLTDPTDRKRVAREIRVLKKLNQANIIRLLEVGEASSRVHVIMEHASGGTLLDHVRKHKVLLEPEARDCFRQILVGLAYCHSQGVIHRDIKLENLLLSANREMKIIDFGLSAIMVPGKKLRVHCGSPSYAAPEIVSRQLYDGPPVDVWSLGVVLFAMITGYLPFHGSVSDKDELCRRIVAGTYDTPDWISNESKDLLRGMLTTDPRRRLTLEQVAEHPWVLGAQPSWRLPSLPAEPDCRPLLDPTILASISKRIDSHSLSESILRGDHTYFTATYHLLATRAQSTDMHVVYGKPDRLVMPTM